MKIHHSKEHLKSKISQLREDNLLIGFVPTMGALHEGHASLIRYALSKNDYVVVSVFVNPTQFDNKDDLDKYPRTIAQDQAFLETISDKILIYVPTAEDIYGEQIESQQFEFGGLDKVMEGRYRKGHFNGVGTVVKKLLQTIEPDTAYFGEKDFQQLSIISKMVELENINVEIVGLPIFRDIDGLAMSSRNLRLEPKYRDAAPFIFEILQTAKEKFGTESANSIVEWVQDQFASHELLKLEYFIIADSVTLRPTKRKSKQKTYRAFIAVYAGNIRLIDNIALN